MTGFSLSSAGLRVLVPRGADCAVLRGGAGGRHGRVVADRSRGAVAGWEMSHCFCGMVQELGIENRGMVQKYRFVNRGMVQSVLYSLR